MLRHYLAGTMTDADKCAALFPDSDECSELLVACHPGDFSASEIARAVEDCDIRLLALSVTAMHDADGRRLIVLRVASRTPDGVARSLARYGYETIHTFSRLTGEEQQRARSRVNELLHYLEI